MSDTKLIEAFGDAMAIVDAFRARGVTITRSAVYQWKRRGVAPRWRRLLVSVARERGITVPRGFCVANERQDQAA